MHCGSNVGRFPNQRIDLGVWAAIARHRVDAPDRDLVYRWTTMSATFESLQRGPAVLYGSCGGIWVMTLFGKPSAAEMLLARPALKAMLEKHPIGFPTLTWVAPQAGYSMEADARHAAADVTKEFNASILAMATLIEGQGFQAAAVRAIVAGLDLMARASAPKKVFADLPATVAWCASMRPPKQGNASAPGEIVTALADIRKSLDAPADPRR